ncbi:hypothetical protein [Patulibacter sp. SYSU D01012]|uniref:hypothetical protein n=1 Tax=Patulibacter sp. SYSU D01012 TaxID=2817381 RepID=UPI001B31117E|nr:hypothetical protein [Patulibacter sp. SYSU D01012]
MTTAPVSAEVPPGYWVEKESGAWMTLPWPPEGDPMSPQFGIGMQVVEWCERWLINHITGERWRFTKGQLRFLLLWYAMRGEGAAGRWLYRSGVKRGAKGTGKDPFLAAMANAELCGPTRPVWHEGRWVGVPHRMALVQIAANSEAQASDVLRVANAMVDADMADEFGYDKGVLRTQLVGTGSRIELLTNSEASAEGDPATAIFLNESHHMTESNGGQKLAAVARRNVGKSPGGMARVIEATNAHMAGEGSVAEDSFEAWQAQAAGRTRRKDILYDSREAPSHLSLHDEEELMAGLRASYFDSPWSDLERLRDEAQDPRVSAADSIRFYFSSLPTSEDAWIDPRKFDALHERVTIEDGEQIAMFLDCSKSTDATVLCACRMGDGHVFAIRGWQRPHGDRGRGWLAPREEVDAEVRAAFARYDVQWFGVDPSPAKDDEDERPYWAELVDAWHRDFRKNVALWATPGVKHGSAVAFDMRLSHPGGRDRVRALTEEAELTAKAIDEEGTLSWGGGDFDAMLRQHVHAARRRPNPWGVSIGKKSRSSSRRVDFAVAMVGARLGRRLALNSGKTSRKRSGRVVGV